MSGMAGQLTIRAASRDDLPALELLYRQLNPADPALDPALADERMSAILAQPGMTVSLDSSTQRPSRRSH
jgi:hypothetical protein